MKLLFVVNPISGGVDKEPFLKKAVALCDRYGINYQIFRTTGKNDRENLLATLDAFPADRIASVGGDGTTLFTGSVLVERKIPMGIIPQGSANGMAKDLFVDPQPMNALRDILLSHKIVDLDLIRVNGEHLCLHLGDTGVNAQIIDGFEKDPNRGMTTYAKYFLEELQKMQPFEYRIEANDQIQEGQCLMLAICNARKYGTGVPLNLNGTPFDGLFELVMLKKINTLSLLKAGMSSFNERFADESDSDIVSASQARITFSESRLVQLDGDTIGYHKELDLEIIKGAIRFISHSDNEYLRN